MNGDAFVRVPVKRPDAPGAAPTPPPAGRSRRVLRHTFTARFMHWVMAVATLVLLVTGLLPVVGVKVTWVTLHWSVGLLLFFAVAWHIIHVLGWQDFWSMWIDARDVHEGVHAVTRALHSVEPRSTPRAGKYPVDRKLHHHGVALAAVVAIATGLLMMVRIDTPLWARDPSLLGDATWGWVYLVHGMASVGLMALVSAHVYFAFRAEKRWITWSMVRGWIPWERYVTHHDPERWRAR